MPDDFEIDESLMDRLRERAITEGCSINELLSRWLETPPALSPNFSTQLLDAVEQAMIVTDLQGKITYWNRAAEALYGWRADEVMGRNVVDVTPLDTQQQDARTIMAQLEQGQAWTGEFKVRRKDGSVFWAHVSDYPVFDADGSLTGIIGISYDVTEQRRNRDALQASEQRYRQIVETAQEGIWLIDLDGNTIYVNQRMAEMLRCTVEEIMRVPVWSFMDEEWKAIAQRNREARRAGIAGQEEFKFKRRDGEDLWVLISNSVVRDSDGHPSGVLGMIIDITERKQIVTKLRRSEESFRTLAENSLDIIQRFDLNGVYIYANSTFAEAMGLTVDEIIGKTNAEIGVTGDYVDRFMAVHRQLIETREPVEMDFDYPLHGEMHHFNAHMIPEFDEKGEIVSVLAVSRDVTERRQAQERAFELALERERLALLTNFIRDAAHEFRTPLTTISASSYLMARTDDPVYRKTKADKVEAQIKQIVTLVERLILMVRLQSETGREQSSLDIGVLLRELCDEVVATRPATQTLKCELAPNLPHINGNTDDLVEAFKQLIENACRFSLDDATIHVSGHHGDNVVHIEIHDNGPGIAPEALPHIFKMFWRADVAHTSPGFGLGLPIAQKIIEQHNGHLTITNAEKGGVRVLVLLPVAASDSPTIHSPAAL